MGEGSTLKLHQDGDHDGSDDHNQYQTLIRCTDKLVLALSGSPRSIADKLVSEELISEEVHKSLQPLSLTSEDIARKMLDSVKTTVRLTPGRYKDFVQILQKDAELRNTKIIDSLHEAYSSILKDQKGTTITVIVGNLKTISKILSSIYTTCTLLLL